MLAKCNCQHCSKHLEFEEEHAGSTILCPECGMETQLFKPAIPDPPKPRRLAGAFAGAAAALNTITKPKSSQTGPSADPEPIRYVYCAFTFSEVLKFTIYFLISLFVIGFCVGLVVSIFSAMMMLD